MGDPVLDFTNPTIAAAWIGFVGGLVVGVINWLWLLYIDWRSRKRIRTMLRIEIENNLRDLRDVHSSARSSLPCWAHSTWDQLRPQVPNALNETEIRNTYSFYADLDNLKRRSGGLGSGDTGTRKRDFDTAVKKLLDGGNPIS